MTIPHELFDADLSLRDFRVACTLLHLSDAAGQVETTLEKLEPLTKLGPEAMRRAFRKLESEHLLVTTRVRCDGVYSHNHYQLLFGLVGA